jgi:hypothetical protein
MAQVDWNSIMNGGAPARNKWSGCNVKMFMVCRKNEQKSAEAGRDIFDEIPSISFRWPGQDETVRALEPQDKMEHPMLWEAFQAGTKEVQSGMPLKEWPKITASAIHELAYLGFRTVEQLAEANDEVKRRMGPLGRFVKEAKEWLDAANSPQSQVVSLRETLEREKVRADRLENQIELLMQRIEGNEGIRFERAKVEVSQEPDVKRGPGRPRKDEE